MIAKTAWDYGLVVPVVYTGFGNPRILVTEERRRGNLKFHIWRAVLAGARIGSCIFANSVDGLEPVTMLGLVTIDDIALRRNV